LLIIIFIHLHVIICSYNEGNVLVTEDLKFV
jgi:hypothetical protein